MNKFDALDAVRNAWKDPALNLYDKAMLISSQVYEASLDIPGTAAFIDATPSELVALLELSELEEEELRVISNLNPPKTTWSMLAKGTPSEIKAALEALGAQRTAKYQDGNTPGQCVYEAMIKVAPPSVEQKLATLIPGAINALRTRGEQSGALPVGDINFLKSISRQRTTGKILSAKQTKWLRSIAENLRDCGLLARDAIGSDWELCNAVLDALEA